MPSFKPLESCVLIIGAGRPSGKDRKPLTCSREVARTSHRNAPRDNRAPSRGDIHQRSHRHSIERRSRRRAGDPRPVAATPGLVSGGGSVLSGGDGRDSGVSAGGAGGGDRARLAAEHRAGPRALGHPAPPPRDCPPDDQGPRAVPGEPARPSRDHLAHERNPSRPVDSDPVLPGSGSEDRPAGPEAAPFRREPTGARRGPAASRPTRPEGPRGGRDPRSRGRAGREVRPLRRRGRRRGPRRASPGGSSRTSGR